MISEKKLCVGELHIYKSKRHPFPLATVILSINRRSLDFIDVVVLNLYVDELNHVAQFQIKTYKHVNQRYGFAEAFVVD